VKFIFATTEIRKVPVTVLSRCQRFDLRRVDVPVLIEHFAKIAANEGAKAEDDALRLIARAAEGSVRDGLSILDQAIAMGAGKVDVASVGAMLGLADRQRIFDLLETMLRGETAATLQQFEALHRNGADPLQALKDLAEVVHAVTRAKIAGEEAAGDAVSAGEKQRAGSLAGQLSVPLLSRVWQMLLKGLDEVGRAPSPMTAAEMVLIRIAHTADLPTPDEIIKALGDGSTAQPGMTSPSPPPAKAGNGESGMRPGPPAGHMHSETTGRPQAAVAVSNELMSNEVVPGEAIRLDRPAALSPQSFEEVLELIGQNRDAMLRMHLEDHASLISFEPGRIEFYPLENAPRGLAGELGEKLTKWTGTRWVAVVGREPGAKPVGEVKRERRAAEIAEIKKHPAVANVLKAFPDAEITDIKPAGDSKD